MKMTEAHVEAVERAINDAEQDVCDKENCPTCASRCAQIDRLSEVAAHLRKELER